MFSQDLAGVRALLEPVNLAVFECAVHSGNDTPQVHKTPGQVAKAGLAEEEGPEMPSKGEKASLSTPRERPERVGALKLSVAEARGHSPPAHGGEGSEMHNLNDTTHPGVHSKPSKQSPRFQHREEQLCLEDSNWGP